MSRQNFSPYGYYDDNDSSLYSYNYNSYNSFDSYNYNYNFDSSSYYTNSSNYYSPSYYSPRSNGYPNQYEGYGSIQDSNQSTKDPILQQLAEIVDQRNSMFRELGEFMKQTVEEIKYHGGNQYQNSDSHQRDDQQVKEGKPSCEEDSNHEGNTKSIDDNFSVTCSSFSCENVGPQYNKEDHAMQDETKTHTTNILACNDSFTPLSDLVSHFECNDDDDYQGIIRWVVHGEVIEAFNKLLEDEQSLEEDLEDEKEGLIKEGIKDEGNTIIIDNLVSVTSLPLPCDDTGTMEDSITQDEWLNEEEELEKESMNPPPMRVEEQLEIEKPPLAHIDFIIPDPISTSPSICNYISLCGVSVKEIICEEHAEQREGNFIRSLECRRLLPLWIFKENLKPD